jgi:hypothetical protein
MTRRSRPLSDFLWAILKELLTDPESFPRRFETNPTWKMFWEFLKSFSKRKMLKQLPNHNPRPFERRLAMADFWIGNDVLAKFDALRFSVRFHKDKMLARRCRFKLKLKWSLAGPVLEFYQTEDRSHKKA